MAIPNTANGNVYNGVVVVPVGQWQGSWMSILAPVTQSDSGGSTLYRATVQENNWSFSVCRDDTSFPEALGFTSGTVLAALYFRHGGTTKADRLTNTTVEAVDPVYDASQDVERVTVRGKGGYQTSNVNLPA
jgi:hypothetical protein